MQLNQAKPLRVCERCGQACAWGHVEMDGKIICFACAQAALKGREGK